jgi:hypothetical protein
MIKIIKFIILLFFVIYFSGCTVKLPPLPSIQPDEIKNVGIATKISNFPKHKHIGITVLHNFEKHLESWHISEQLKQGLSDCLKSRYGCNVIVFDNKEFIYEELNFIVIEKDGQWIFNQEYKYVLDRLRNEYNLDVLIGIADGVVHLEHHRAEGYGLFTRSYLMFDSVYAYYALVPFITYLDKPGRIGALEYLPNKEDFKEKITLDTSFDINNIEESEVDEAKQRVLNFVDTIIDTTCDAVFKIEEE